MSSHRSILGIHDVLYFIFQYLDPSALHPEDSYQADHLRSSLASAAVTCRALSELALDVLWKTLPCEEPLLQLLDNHGVTAEKSPADNQAAWKRFQSDEARVCEWIIGAHKGRLTPPQCGRFRNYAARVRSITLRPFINKPSLWGAILPSPPQEPILPCLREALIHGAFTDDYEDFDTGSLLVIPSSVQSLTFHIFPELEATRQCLKIKEEQNIIEVLLHLSDRLIDLQNIAKKDL